MRETKTNTGSTTCATQTLSETETFRSSAVRYQHVALLPDFLGSLQLLDRKQHGRARLDEAYRKAAPSLLANRVRHLSSRRRLSSLDDTYRPDDTYYY
ncbi:hypothetical protein OUZ56_029210 [Daphnia magna]|uniref:Uncharacterized protein n=1 Tax=Daphnia magna TaxID=35525 RepID=A0ABR0B671_9CRUS|nr:hypothetical protein OUZ56_029210 [Daphnia magna]